MFPFFYQSCIDNSKIDFLIFTNEYNKVFFKKEENHIRVVYIDWNDFQQIIQSKFDFKVSLESPYKLCDYKPAYGYIFQEYLSGYEYWGHCDCDLIWGNLNMLNKLNNRGGYERIGEYGHLILYKNTEEVNTWFKTLKAEGVPSYQTVYSSGRNFSFDEFAGMNILVKANHKKVYTDRFFDDIIFYKRNFWSRRLINGKDTKWNPCFFLYENGVLKRSVWRNNKWLIDESLYVHFQKRELKIETADIKHFIVIPDRIIPRGLYSDEELKKRCSAPLWDKRYWMMWLKMYTKKIYEKFNPCYLHV